MIKKQFIRFISVGLLSTIISYSIFFVALRTFSLHYLLAAVAGFLVGVGVGFSLNKNWTFSSKEARSHEFILHYFSVYTLSMIISLIFLRITVGGLGIPAEIANILAIGITTCTNFIGTKFFVFKK